jgi:hypothetical protein
VTLWSAALVIVEDGKSLLQSGRIGGKARTLRRRVITNARQM